MGRVIGLPRTWEEAEKFREQARENKSNDLIKTNHEDYLLLKEDEEKIEELSTKFNLFKALIEAAKYEWYVRKAMKLDKELMG